MLDVETVSAEKKRNSTISGALPEVVRFHNVSVEYFLGSKKRRFTALKNFSLTLRKGEFISILGPSGCGKTTLLKTVAGLVNHSLGEVQVLGHSPQIACRNGEIGYVFQEPVLLPWSTVLSNIELPRIITKRNQSFDINFLIKLVKLEEFSDAFPTQLSGGMRSRVAIARALSTKPSVLLMDEPFASLDALTRDQMQEELQDIINSINISVLFVTHSIEEAIFLSDNIIVLGKAGKPVQSQFTVPFPKPRNSEIKYTKDFQMLVSECRKALM